MATAQARNRALIKNMEAQIVKYQNEYRELQEEIAELQKGLKGASAQEARSIYFFINVAESKATNKQGGIMLLTKEIEDVKERPAKLVEEDEVEEDEVNGH